MKKQLEINCRQTDRQTDRQLGIQQIKQGHVLLQESPTILKEAQHPNPSMVKMTMVCAWPTFQFN